MLELRQVSVRFDTFALDNISFVVEKGDYMTLLGVSGAGKTVLLEVLAGLVKPSGGSIFLHGVDISTTKIQQRGIGLVYQDLCLFPHMNVFDNIAYSLRPLKYPHRVLTEKVREMANETGVLHLLERYPMTLSGGEAQRLALARTLAADPEVLLLDEPLANLDVKRKGELRGLLRAISKKGKTIIHVTHDYMEAATLSNKVAIIENGRLQQTGAPEQVFRHPASEFVARFSGVRNIFPCVPLTEGSGTDLQKVFVQGLGELFFTGDKVSRDGYVMIDQQGIILSDQAWETSALNRFKGTVTEAYQAGHSMEIIVNAGVDFVVTISHASYDKFGIKPGKEIWLNFKASSARFINN